MAYIDPEGMFNGDRMAMLSDGAKYAWPYFWCASNTVGRIELNYRKFMQRAFHHFHKKPTEEQFWLWVEQYWQANLLFVYEVDGERWGQWDVSERYLPRHKLAADKRTPAPVGAELDEWKTLYIKRKKLQTSKLFTVNNSARLARTCVDKEMEKEVEEEKTPLPPLQGGVLPSPPVEKPSKPPAKPKANRNPKRPALTEAQLQIVEPAAITLLGRHPERKCSLKIAKTFLAHIVRLAGEDKREEVLAIIDRNHAGWCQSRDWTKDNGSFCPGLEKWLLPEMERYLVQPPVRAGPEVRTKNDRAVEILMRNLELERKT